MALLSQSLPSLPRFFPVSQAKRRTLLVQPLYHTNGIKRHELSICLASSNPSNNSISSNLVELPIFPLPLVLFPGMKLPLKIFEYRYRIMLQTLIQTDLRFGILFSNPTDPSSASVEVGCVAEVVQHQKHPNDHFFIICKGQERFRINYILRTKPYMVAAVNWLEDRPPPDPAQGDDMEKLTSEVENYLKDVIRLSYRLDREKKDPQKADVDLWKGLFPTPFSFIVGSYFGLIPNEQQVLLEMEDTAARLKRERDILKSTLNCLTALTAVEDAFPPNSHL
ncbi:uncharacterized protein LOC144575060 [Carex rostrata]